MSNIRSTQRLVRWLPFGLIGAMWLWFCGPMMLGMTVVGFRDSAYLYFPMFEAIDLAWGDGKVPLWNPFCNFGMPLVADGTSSVFYPGKIVFFARFLSYPSRYGIYLSAHVLWAAASTYWLARKLRCGRPGATLAAISFAFGGPAIFQVTNVIYLVSAAWLPIAIGAVWNFIHGSGRRWSIVAAVACAMMILGGDPQMVYHIGLIAAVSIGCNGVRVIVRRLRANAGVIEQKWQLRRQQLFLKQLQCLVTMVVGTSLLAAVQILPTAELAQRSERSAGGRVVNFYSLMGREKTESQNDRPEKSSLTPLLAREGQVVGQYQFSLPPWALMEMLAPNISGKPFPRNERWTDLLPSNDRMWFASLYVGLIVVVLALAQIRFWGRNRINVWVSWILLTFLFGSFGWYGAVWAWRELVGVPESGEVWAAPVGGVYWWMSTALPKYFSFRYPAKLFMLASLAISLLAGRALGPTLRSSFTLRWTVGVGVLLLDLTLILFLWFGADGHLMFEPLVAQSMNAQTMFGPFQAAAAGIQLRTALVHTMVMTTLLVGLFLLIEKFGASCRSKLKFSSQRQVLGWLLVVLTSVDLAVANRWLLAEAPAEVFQRELKIESELAKQFSVEPFSNAPSAARPPTMVLANHFPLQFLVESSESRLSELVDWQRQTLQARHHLVRRVRLIGSFHSIWPEQYQRFVSAYVDQGNQMISQKDDWLTGANFRSPKTHEDTVSLSLVFWGDESVRVLSREAPVSSIAQKEFGNLLLAKRGGVSIDNESFDWNETQFAIQVHRPMADSWFELPVLYDRGWRVELRFENEEWQTGMARCTDRDLLELKLPNQCGDCEVRMIYRPVRFYVGAGLSLVSWFLVLGIAMGVWVRK
jgi:uncharacterized glyoxalase superfamily protein PhnB